MEVEGAESFVWLLIYSYNITFIGFVCFDGTNEEEQRH